MLGNDSLFSGGIGGNNNQSALSQQLAASFQALRHATTNFDGYRFVINQFKECLRQVSNVYEPAFLSPDNSSHGDYDMPARPPNALNTSGLISGGSRGIGHSQSQADSRRPVFVSLELNAVCSSDCPGTLASSTIGSHPHILYTLYVMNN
jgi:hypothetical protein